MDDAHKRSLDLRGEVCPYTFVKSKLVMEQLNLGEILEIIVDYRPAVSNIPMSMETEGHEVMEVVALNSKDWRLVVRKGSP